MRGVDAKRPLVVATVLAMAAVACPAVAQAAYPGKNGKLAIEGDTRPGIWTVKPNGNDLTRVTGKKGLPFNPSWSPDGKRIAFTKSGDLWKMRADGSHKEKLAKGVSSDIDTNISWAPNGRKLVFNKRDDLWTVQSNGKGANKRIAKTADAETAPSWSPNGDVIAFEFRDAVTADLDLRLIQPNGAGEVSIPNTKNGMEPDWAPNGKRLAYSAPGTGIVLIKPNGTGQTTFAKSGNKGFVADPAWSPDGEQIAYAHSVSLSRTPIVRKRVAGGKEHVVVKRKHWFSPSWQPVK
jgi:Tol biopolymer transport system component